MGTMELKEYKLGDIAEIIVSSINKKSKEEEELVKLATEKEHVKKQKDFYQRVSDFSVTAEQPVIRGEMFFSGVESRQSLKKRYKDLIKIYHPDNLDGDKNTVQEINSEYHKLCAVYKN